MSILNDWLTDQGPTDRTYGPGDPRTQQMMHAPGVNAAREEYIRTHCQSTRIIGNFGFWGSVRAGFNATRQQVGGYLGSTTPVQHGREVSN